MVVYVVVVDMLHLCLMPVLWLSLSSFILLTLLPYQRMFVLSLLFSLIFVHVVVTFCVGIVDSIVDVSYVGFVVAVDVVVYVGCDCAVSAVVVVVMCCC